MLEAKARIERKDRERVDPEIKSIFEEQAKTFEQFKTAQDAFDKEIKKLGSADAVTAEKVEKLSKALDDNADKIKTEMRKLQDYVEDFEAKFNRGKLGGGGAAGNEVETKAIADFSRFTGQQMSVDEFREYKLGLDTYVRYGDKGRQPELKALSVGSDPDGGYWVTPDTTGRMVAKIYETSPIRQLASVDTIGTDVFEGPIDNDEADAGWVGEKSDRPETDTPQIGKWTIAVNEVYAEPRSTQKLLEDASFSVEGWLTRKVSEKIGRVENAAFIKGDGVLKPKGIFSYSFAATSDKAGRAWGTFEYVASGGAGAFAASNPGDAIIDLVMALKAGYRQNATFLCTRGTVAKIRKFKDGQGQYLWQPALVAGQPSMLLGFPLTEAEDIDEIAANSYSLAFGDWRETYQIVDRVGLSVLRDPYTKKGWVKFYTRRRTGGGVVNFESAKFMKFATS
jgi:HK97 family phage major capsid protein